jgi:flagellar basal body-associated protein FliL
LGLEGEGLGADSDGFGEDGAGADGEDGEGEGADGEGLGDGQEPPPRFEEPKSASDTRDRAPYERQRPPIQGVDDQSRADFLKSLMDGDGDAVPQKVELDLDGIFDQARKEAEKLSPDATSLPVEAPEPESETAPPPPEEHIDLAPLSAGGVKKVARYKMLIVLSTLGVVVLCTLFALYRIFFRTVPPPPQTRPFVVEPDPLTSSRVPIPGEMPLGRFYLTLGDPQNAVVVEMEITLHYHDSFDAPIILREMTLIRDIIYRLVAPLGPELLTDTGVRRGLQADLLQTLNNIEALRSDAADPRLTYVQISALTKR